MYAAADVMGAMLPEREPEDKRSYQTLRRGLSIRTAEPGPAEKSPTSASCGRHDWGDDALKHLYRRAERDAGSTEVGAAC